MNFDKTIRWLHLKIICSELELRAILQRFTEVHDILDFILRYFVLALPGVH